MIHLNYYALTKRKFSNFSLEVDVSRGEVAKDLWYNQSKN